ncbi:MAG: DUF3422 family protein [Alphaproteobacteria bacterium]|nr:DUF3422 family protein [Alphaproteobacteria bacterium]MBV9694615.1 DUF3422 family protein [Alphaproteobacteria bacterium]
MAIWAKWRAQAPNVVALGGVAPNEVPDDAFKSLMARLRELTRIINSAPEEKAKRLEHYRDVALATGFDNLETFRSPYFDRLFPYVHNEFLFNSARKCGPLAQIAHLTFTPLFVDRLCKSALADTVSLPHIYDDPMKMLDEGTYQTVEWLWDLAIYDSKRCRDFRGGKDHILQHVRNLPDFSEPFATPKRYILAMKKAAMATVSAGARAETAEYDSYFKRSGISNNFSNTVEFLWRSERRRKGHFRWARHDRPYETFTFSNEYAHTVDEDASAIELGSEKWTQTILDAIAGKNENGENHPFDRNALEDLKFDAFEKVMGRYIHGANFLVLPLKLFLNCTLAQQYAHDAPQSTLLERLIAAAPAGRIDHATMEAWRRWAEDPSARGLWDEKFRAFLRSFTGNTLQSDLDAMVIGATSDFLLNHCFLIDNRDRFDSEFVGYKCMSGRAYVFTDVRNRPHRKMGEHEGLFSRSVIIDCGMNQYERGRLIQTLTEFSSERLMSLQWLARSRLVHHALNVIQTRLSLALSYYQRRLPQPEETLPPHYADLVTPLGDGKRAEGLLSALEFLSSCLSVLNDVVDGGIMDRSQASNHSHHAILDKLKSVREQPLPGYQSLSEYLERRVTRPLRTMERAGERYGMLRRRITEIAELVNVRMQAQQNSRLQFGLNLGFTVALAAIVVAIVALGHPLGEIIKGLKSSDKIDFEYAVAISATLLVALAPAYFVAREFFGAQPKWWKAHRRRG